MCANRASARITLAGHRRTTPTTDVVHHTSAWRPSLIHAVRDSCAALSLQRTRVDDVHRGAARFSRASEPGDDSGHVGIWHLDRQQVPGALDDAGRPTRPAGVTAQVTSSASGSSDPHSSTGTSRRSSSASVGRWSMNIAHIAEASAVAERARRSGWARTAVRSSAHTPMSSADRRRGSPSGEIEAAAGRRVESRRAASLASTGRADHRRTARATGVPSSTARRPIVCQPTASGSWSAAMAAPAPSARASRCGPARGRRRAPTRARPWTSRVPLPVIALTSMWVGAPVRAVGSGSRTRWCTSTPRTVVVTLWMPAHDGATTSQSRCPTHACGCRVPPGPRLTPRRLERHHPVNEPCHAPPPPLREPRHTRRSATIGRVGGATPSVRCCPDSHGGHDHVRSAAVPQ